MSHIYKTKIKILSSQSLQELENKLNEFILTLNEEYAKPIIGNITTQEINQSGMMLCDRIDPSSNYAYSYIIPITYTFDYTQSKMDLAKEEWLYQKSKDYKGYVPNPMTLEQLTLEQFLEQSLKSQEFKNYISSIELNYSEYN